jgi:lipopolysaccharide cholinephosphotransferase
MKPFFKFLCIPISSIVISCNQPDHDFKTIQQLTYMESDAVQDLYQMLKDTTEIFDRAGIRYSASSGTLLGAVRHGGLIPWDDDADLVILHEDELKLNTAKAAFSELGYQIVIDPWDSSVYRISKLGNPKVRDKITFPFIDVATVSLNKKEQKVMYVNWRMQQYFPTEWFKPEAFFPLSKCKFGPIMLTCIHDSQWYLSHYYGQDWNKTAKIVPRHYKPNHTQTFMIQFSEHPESLQPALPQKPLTDRVRTLSNKLFKN